MITTRVAPEGEPLDVVCIGFGPTGLSLALALQESTQALNFLVIERAQQFSWRGGRLSLGKAHMRTNVLQDLVTLRDPLSEYTFLNYLFVTSRLVGYTNLGTTHPPRQLFAHYLQWCAQQVEDLGCVRYGQQAVAIEAICSENNTASLWKVTYKNIKSGLLQSVAAKRVVIAVGNQPKLATPLYNVAGSHNVLHSSHFKLALPKVLENAQSGLEIAIVGADDEAVDIMEHCRSLASHINVTMFTNDVALRATDSNPFIANLANDDDGKPYELRHHPLTHANLTSNPQSVQQQRLADLYSGQYSHGISVRSRRTGKLDIRPGLGLLKAFHAQNSSKILLEQQNIVQNTVESTGPFDYVVSATGYRRGRAERILQPLKSLLDTDDGHATVDKDYRVNFRRGAVSKDAGIWVLGSFDDANPDVFSFVALRTDRLLKSLFRPLSEQLDQTWKVDPTSPVIERAVL